MNSEIILNHSFKRGLYAIPLVTNFRSFLKGESDVPRYRNLPLEKLVDHWRNRWFFMRKGNPEIIDRVQRFLPEHFDII